MTSQLTADRSHGVMPTLAQQVDKAVRAGQLDAVYWHHANLGRELPYPFRQLFPRTVRVGPQGVYVFSSLRYLQLRHPELVLELLFSACGIDPPATDIHRSLSSCHEPIAS